MGFVASIAALMLGKLLEEPRTPVDVGFAGISIAIVAVATVVGGALGLLIGTRTERKYEARYVQS